MSCRWFWPRKTWGVVHEIHLILIAHRRCLQYRWERRLSRHPHWKPCRPKHPWEHNMPRSGWLIRPWRWCRLLFWDNDQQRWHNLCLEHVFIVANEAMLEHEDWIDITEDYCMIALCVWQRNWATGLYNMRYGDCTFCQFDRVCIKLPCRITTRLYIFDWRIRYSVAEWRYCQLVLPRKRKSVCHRNSYRHITSIFNGRSSMPVVRNWYSKLTPSLHTLWQHNIFYW